MNILNISKRLAALTGAVFACACGSSGPRQVPPEVAVCNEANGPFSATIDNPYLPFPVGAMLVLEGLEAGAHKARIEVTVLDETRDIVGVPTRVVEVKAYDDDVLVEIAREFYSQTADGTVCLFGEEEELYENGKLVEEDGWEHGEDRKIHAAISMPGTIEVGVKFTASYDPPEVEVSEITKVAEETVTPADTFADTITVLEVGPSIKKYARDVGQIFDDGVELITY